jgi:hypothetical protein
MQKRILGRNSSPWKSPFPTRMTSLGDVSFSVKWANLFQDRRRRRRTIFDYGQPNRSIRLEELVDMGDVNELGDRHIVHTRMFFVSSRRRRGTLHIILVAPRTFPYLRLQSSEWKRPDGRREISMEPLKLSIDEVMEEGRRTDTPCHRPQISLISVLQLRQRLSRHCFS